MIRVLLADDHEVVRFGLGLVLTTHPDLELVGMAASAEEALDLVPVTNPDVVLMDLSMPGLGGLVALRLLRRDHPGLRLLVLTTDTRRTTVDAALDAGADGYLVKEGSHAEVVRAVRLVHSGGFPLSASIARTVGA